MKADEGLTHREAMSKAGEMWHKMSEAEKKKYDEMHEQDKKR